MLRFEEQLIYGFVVNNIRGGIVSFSTGKGQLARIYLFIVIFISGPMILFGIFYIIVKSKLGRLSKKRICTSFHH